MDTDSPESPAAADAELARREVTKLVNTQIRVTVESEVLAHGTSEHKYGFLCECGCMKMIELPLAAYDSSGAWLDDHKPK